MSHGSTPSRRKQLRGADELAAAKTGSTPVPLEPLPSDLNPNKDTLTTSKLPAPTTTSGNEPSSPASASNSSTISETKQCPAADMLNLDTPITPMK